MSETPLLEELSRLDAEVSAAREHRGSSKAAAEEASWRVHKEAVSDLHAYGDDVAFKRREPDESEQRRVTLELLDRVRDEGLLLESVRGGLRISDPRPAAEHREATAAAAEAHRRRAEFERANRRGIEAERRRADMDRVRGALAGDDPAALREALAGTR